MEASSLFALIAHYYITPLMGVFFIFGNIYCFDKVTVIFLKTYKYK